MRVLALDSGSSSLKYAVYEMPAERLAASSAVDGDAAAQTDALDGVIKSVIASGAIDAVGHRIVLGGPEHTTHEPFTDALVAELEALEALDPLHLPAQLRLVRRAREALPSAMHAACFDTAFFRDMPAAARRYSLPASLGPEIRRYGFHGLSYEYVASTGLTAGRTVVAHLGSGASMTAMRDGAPLDTTMGFSPLGGLMMGTRPGDLDPGVLLYLLRRTGAPDVDMLTRMLNEQSGLLGVSQTSADMRELIARSPADDRARNAVELFVYLAVKHANSLTGVCGGLDTLIFTGGIGERAPSIRQGICAGLAHLGVEVDEAPNARSERKISSAGSAVDVLVVPTNESVVIARHTHALVRTAF